MQGQMLENSTKLFSLIVSSPSSSPLSSTTSSPHRTRTVINVIYILGIVFMIIVFLLLLWINLYSQKCWCWHDTPLIHRFNRQWFIKNSMRRNTTNSQREGRSLNDDELQS